MKNKRKVLEMIVKNGNCINVPCGVYDCPLHPCICRKEDTYQEAAANMLDKMNKRLADKYTKRMVE